MRIITNIFSRYSLGFLGIILMSCTPVLFDESHFFNFQVYFSTFWEVLKSFLIPSEWQLNFFNYSTSETGSITFLDYFKGPYLYSMQILISSILLALFTSFILSHLTLLSKGFFRRTALKTARFLESFPDFSYIFFIQILVVQFYLLTDLIILDFYSLGGNLVYLAPILCLSVLPTILFYKLFILLYEEEWRQPYIELARSKGLNHFEILLKHCTSNVLKSLFYNSKSIVWLTLSSLLIIEYLFGMEGILYYLMSDFSPKGTSFILLSVFTPFFIFYSVVERMVDRERIERNTIFEKFSLPFWDVTQIRSIFKFHRMRDNEKSASTTILTYNTFKRRRVIVPLLIVLSLLGTSLLYNILYDDQIDQINYIYNDEGAIVSTAPHPPTSDILFGTDPYGYSIFQQLLVGIKYTILITLLIATLRVVVGYLFSIFYVFYFNQRSRKIINSLSDGMHFLPLTLLVFVLLTPLLINSTGVWILSFTERLSIQVLIMSIIVLPVTTSLIGNEMNETLKKEYVQSSVVMGGSLVWILLKHINPQLWPKLVLFWTQHMVQVLQMFVHLGILNIFVGGAAFYSDTPNRLIPEIYELSGMIAISREVFVTNQFWMILPPLFIFMLLIYCFNTIADAISQQQQSPLFKRIKKSMKVVVSDAEELTLDTKRFTKLGELK